MSTDVTFWTTLAALIATAALLHWLSRGKSAQKPWPRWAWLAWAFSSTWLLVGFSALFLFAMVAPS